jgi:peptide/nickel transport system substrate-binding protein
MESPYAGDWAALDHVEVTDKHSGVLVLKDFSPTVWTIAIPGNSGCIVCKAAVDALPEKKFTTEVPAYSGRYAIKEWVPKQRTVFEPNPKWSGEPVAFQQIVIVPIEDAAAREIAFEAGDVDFGEISLGTLARYQKDGVPAGAKLIDVPSLAYVWIGLNIDNPALGDVRVRRAIQKAVDVDAALEAGYFGVAERATGIVAPSLLGHRNIESPKRDVDGAKALLQEAGVDGLKLTLDVGLDSHELNIAQVVQASLADVGVEVTIKQNDSATFWSLGDEKSGDQWKQVQLILNRFSMSPDPAYATEWFTPEQVGVWNWERFNNPEFGELHAAAKFEKDEQKRAGMYVRMQDLMEESGAYIFLTHERRAYLYRDTISVALNPAGEPLLRLFKPV